jgi:PhzF family phenazine biosynthesis protein
MDKLQKIEVQILNAFTDNDEDGNPAGVVLNADVLTVDQKLKIASAVGLSETAFVSKSDSADFKLDFFTPNKQIAHCGHATIATFSYLRQLGKIDKQKTSKETIDGLRRIMLNGDFAFMEQKAPVYTGISNRRNEILASLSLREEEMIPGAPISMVNTGNSFFIIPVSSSAVLKNIHPRFDLIATLSEEFDLIGYYVFTTETDDPLRDVSTRMFAPRYGIEEESATGMAAGPLACYLYDVLKIENPKFLIQQGKYMEQPSISLIVVELEIEEGTIISLMAGGSALFDIGKPLLMNLDDIVKFVKKSYGKIYANHMEALNHYPATIKRFIEGERRIGESAYS